MKTNPSIKNATWIVTSIMFLIWAQCRPPQVNVDQPLTAEKHSSFEADVNVSYGGDDNDNITTIMSKIGVDLPEEIISQVMTEGDNPSNTWRFGIKIPEGWQVKDSIRFDGIRQGRFVYSDSLSQEMDSLHPPAPGYGWWIAETDRDQDNITGSIEFTPEITTNATSGNFFIDYIFAWPDLGNPSWNFGNYIAVGLADTAYVTTLAENGAGSIRAAIDSIMPGGHIFFNLPYAGAIFLSEQIEIYKDVNFHGTEHHLISISGNDTCRVLNIHMGMEVSITNLRIMDGNAYDAKGGGIYGEGENILNLNNVKILGNKAASGGGLFINGTVILENTQIYNNIATAGSGGGINIGGTLQLKGACIHHNESYDVGGGIYYYGNGAVIFDPDNLSSIYENTAPLGFDIYNNSGDIINVVLDRFTVEFPNDYFTHPARLYTFSIQEGTNEQYEADLWVSPEGSDANSGLHPSEPKRTISNALAWIHGTAINPHTIHLAPGTYSSGLTGEYFPLYCRSNVSVSGSSQDLSILDGEEQFRVFEIYNADQISLWQMIIQYANNSAIYCNNSSPSISDITIRDCEYAPALLIDNCQDIKLLKVQLHRNNILNTYYNVYSGIKVVNSTVSILNSDIFDNAIGIHSVGSDININNSKINDNMINSGLIIEDLSTVNLTDCKIHGNNAEKGGGIQSFDGSTINLFGCTIKNNTAAIFGGGVYIDYSFLIFDDNHRSDIYHNEASRGSDIYSESSHVTDVVVDTFSVLHPNGYYACPVSAYTFNILNCMQAQYDQDLFVSTTGSDENTGLTPDDPLKTITEALRTIYTSGAPNTIHLAPGIYSGTSTGEQFPLFCQSKVNIIGDTDSTTTLNGELTSKVLHIEDVTDFSINNFRVWQGTNGIYARNSRFALDNIIVQSNEGNEGAGIYMRDSEITMNNVNFDHNYSTNYYIGGGGGIYITGECKLITDNVSITNNYSKNGGGIYLDNAVVTLQNIYLYNNSTNPGNHNNDDGGGILCNNSDVILKDIVLESNRSTSGGGMAIVNSDPYIDNVVFKDNRAQESGGGLIVHTKSSPTINNTRFENNRSYISGGGIFLYDSTEAKLVEVNFEGNTARFNGGGMFCLNSQSELETCNFINNEAENGAGLYIDGGEPLLTDISIAENTSENDGGGIYLINSAKPYIIGANIHGNHAIQGGGIFSGFHSRAFLSECTVKGNYGNTGGGIYFLDKSTAGFDADHRCNIYLNNAVINGADLYSERCGKIPVIVDTFSVINPSDYFAYQTDNFEFDILNFKLGQGEYDIYVSPDGSDDNSGTSIDEPLLTLHAATTKALTDSVPPHIIHLAGGNYSASVTGEQFPFYGRSDMWIIGEGAENTIIDGDSDTLIMKIIGVDGFYMADVSLRNGFNDDMGGGVYCDESDVLFERVNIQTCFGKYGGGMFVGNGSGIELVDVLISNNKARRGGGIYCTRKSTILGNSALISGNIAAPSGGGGGIYCYRMSGYLLNLYITDNEAKSGGGIYCYRNSPLIYNNVIMNNSSTHNGGGLCISYADSIMIMNTSFSGNSANRGGAIHSSGSDPTTIFNCILWDNNYYEVSLSASDLIVGNNNMKGDSNNFFVTGSSTIEWLEGNINEDPLFSGSTEHPLSIEPGSPCIDAGFHQTLTHQRQYFWDIIGHNRCIDGNLDGVKVIDMGAYEYVPSDDGFDRADNIQTSFNPRPSTVNSLFRVYPNPCKDICKLDYKVGSNQYAAGSKVNINLYTLNGTKMKTIVQETQTPGDYTVQSDVSDLPDGIYIVRLLVGEHVETSKLIVMK